MKVTIPIFSDGYNISKDKELTISKYGDDKIRLSTGGWNITIVNADQLRKALEVLREDE